MSRYLRNLARLRQATPQEHRDEQGRLHNVDGPAVIYADGTKAYLIHGQRHRTTGPAVEWSNGEVEYWLNGQQLSEEDFHAAIAASR